MALDPSIILQQRRMPSYQQERMLAEQIQALQQEREIRALGIQEKRRISQEYAALAALAQQAATASPQPSPPPPVSQGAMVPPAMPGESYGADVLMQRQAIPGGDIQRIAASQPGMQYQRMDAAQQAPGLQRQATQEAATTYDDGFPKLRWQDVMRVAPTVGPQWMANYEKYTQGDLKERLAILKDGMDMYGDTLNAIVDQPSLDAGRAALKKYVKDLAPLLPEKYEKDDIERRRQQFVPMKTRIDQMQTGLESLYAKGPGDRMVALAPTKGGGFVERQLPPGVTELLPPTKLATTPTGIVPYGPGGVPMGQTTPIDPGAVAQTKAKGAELGEAEAKKYEDAPKAYEALNMQQATYGIVQGSVAKIKALLNAKKGIFPSSGPLSRYLRELPGTNAEAIKGEINTLASNLGLTGMMQLKGAGSTLTPVTDRDVEILVRTVADLPTAQNQGDATLLEKLDIVEKHFGGMLERNQSRFDTVYKPYMPASQRPSRPASSSGTMFEQKGTPISRTWIRELAARQSQKQGRTVSEAEIEQRLQQSGYTIGR